MRTIRIVCSLMIVTAASAQILCISTDSTTGNETISSCVSGWCIKAEYNGTTVKMCDDGGNSIDCWAFGNTCKDREMSDVKATYCCCEGNLCNHAFSTFREGSLLVMLIALLSTQYG